jgi:replicative DNA helicase
MEEAILGALLIDKRAIEDVPHLQPEHFYLGKHQALFRAFRTLYTAGHPIDLLTAARYLKKNDAETLAAIGGEYGLTELTNKVASTANIEFHARLIEQMWMSRELIRLCYSTAHEAYTADPFDTMQQLDTGLTHINALRDNQGQDAARVVSQLKEKAAKIAAANGDIVGFPLFGLPSLDRITMGAQGGELIVVSGSTGGGKSSLNNNILYSCLANNEPVYSWSGELAPTQQAARLASMISAVNGLKITSGIYLKDDDYLERVNSAFARIEKAQITWDYGTMTLQKITSVVSGYNKRYGVKYFLFDRLELIDQSHKRDEDAAKAAITTKMRQLANAYGVTIVLHAQLRKSYADRPGAVPTLGDILGSGAIGQDATQVVLINRPEVHGYDVFQDGSSATGKAEIMVVKNTNGALGFERFDFHAARTCFSEVGQQPVPRAPELLPWNTIANERPPEGEALPF